PFMCDRLIVRHGPDYEVLGYQGGTSSKMAQSTYMGVPVLRYIIRRKGGEYVDVLFDYFKTSRWKKAIRRRVPMYDGSLTDSHNPDHWFLVLNERGLHDNAAEVYRKLKKANREEDR